MAVINGYFNARSEGDTRPKGMFSGIDGDTAEEIIPNIQDFLKAAGRNYGILRVPAFVNDPFGGLDDDGNVVPALREVENQFHLARTSDGHVVSPKTVTAQYAPMTLMDVALEVQPWCDAGWSLPILSMMARMAVWNCFRFASMLAATFRMANLGAITLFSVSPTGSAAR